MHLTLQIIVNWMIVIAQCVKDKTTNNRMSFMVNHLSKVILKITRKQFSQL